jgi:hypothetical protein
MELRNPFDRAEIRRLSEEIHWNDAPCLLGNDLFDRLRVDCEWARQDIRKNRPRPHGSDGFSSRNKGIGAGDDFIPRTNARRQQCQL